MIENTFQVRGVIEGFYGVFYTFPERVDLIRFLGQHGFNTYIYAPKNDRQHRARWWEPYPPRQLQEFEQTAAAARAAGVAFCYALGPGASICYAGEEDFQRLTAKYQALYDCGVRSFSLFLDDIDPEFNHDLDRSRYSNYAQAQADLSNRVYAWLQALDPACSLSLCPTDYSGCPPFSPYLVELGRSLHPAIDLFYTGPQVCSPQITARDAQAFAREAGRAPLIWDNYPVNDLGMQAEMHIGPLRGRSADLGGAVKGLLANCMPQAEASKIALLTLSEYFASPETYDPEHALERALRQVGGDESILALRCFAENSMYSCFGTSEAARLEVLVVDAMAALYSGEPASASPPVAALRAYLQCMDESCYHLRYRMQNLALRANLLPWVELMDTWQDMGQRALRVLVSLERGENCAKDLAWMKEMMAAARKHPKRIAGWYLMPLAEYVLGCLQAQENPRARETASPAPAAGFSLS